MKAILLETPIQVGDLDAGCDAYTHVRIIGITSWSLETNRLTISCGQGYVDSEGNWNLGSVMGVRGFEILGDDYADAAGAVSSAADEKCMDGFIAQILSELLEDNIYSGTVVDI